MCSNFSGNILRQNPVDLTFWSTLSSHVSGRGAGSALGGAARSAQSLVDLRPALVSPSTKRFKSTNMKSAPETTRLGAESSDVSLSLDAIKDFTCPTKFKPKLRTIATLCPQAFRGGIDLNSIEINSKALGALLSILKENPANPSVRAFVEKRCVDFIRQGGQNTSRKMRDEIIEKIIIENPVDSLVVKMLVDDRFRSTIFPGHHFTIKDLKKFSLLRDMLNGQNPAQYDFLCDNIDALQSGNIEDERLPFVLAVVAKGIELSEQIDLSALMKMNILDLAKELVQATARDQYNQINAVVSKVMQNSLKKSNQLIGAKLLAFLAEQPNFVEVFVNFINQSSNAALLSDLRNVIAESKTHIQTFGHLLQAPDDVISTRLSKMPAILVGLSDDGCINLQCQLAKFKQQKIADFYTEKNDPGAVNFICEMLRRHTETKMRMANSYDEMLYVSALHDMESALFKGMLQMGLDVLPDDEDKIGLWDLQALIKIHKDLLMPMQSHSPKALAKLMGQARLIKASLDTYLPDPEALSICPQMLTMIAVNYELVKKNGATREVGYPLDVHVIRDFLRLPEGTRSSIRRIKNREWITFVNKHLMDFSKLSAETLRELMNLNAYIRSGNPRIANAAREMFMHLDAQWLQFMGMVDIAKQRNLQGWQALLNRNARTPGALAPGIHSTEVSTLVARTASVLVDAYKQVDAYQQAGVVLAKATAQPAAKANDVIEPIPANILNPAIEAFESAIKEDIVKDAANITLYQKGKAAEDYVKLPSYDGAIKIQEEAYAQVRSLAKEVQDLTTEISTARSASTPVEPKLESDLIDKRAQLETLNKITRAYGALMYLESKHFASDPKNLMGTTLPKMTIKQLFGMSLKLPELNNLNWHEGLDTLELRQEAVYERLTEALHDSHIAYLGTLHDQSNSCWDGGTNRLMLAVRLLINFDLMPASVDFANEFHKTLIELLISFATPAFLNDDREASMAIHWELSNLIYSDDRTVSRSLYEFIRDDHYQKMLTVYPQMGIESNRVARDSLMEDAIKSLEYIDLPEELHEAYGSAASQVVEDADLDQKPAAKRHRAA